MANINEISKLHNPVLLKEVLEVFGIGYLAHLKKSSKIIDATLGLGGHTEFLVKGGAQVLGIEADVEMFKLAELRLKEACPASEIEKFRGSYILVHANFNRLLQIAQKAGFTNADGILLDLGVSSPQITSEERGISFRNREVFLDMRIDKDSNSVRGADLLNILRADQLRELFLKTLDFRNSRKLTDAIVERRIISPFVTVGDFIDVVAKAITGKPNLNVATLPFLALRMAVNSELENLVEVLPHAVSVLKSGGRVAVITFHSGEDDLVVRQFRKFEKEGLGRVITRKPIVPSSWEIESNPRSRSSKLRVFQKK